MGIGITRGGVVGEVHIALAAIDLHLQHVEEGSVAVPAPVEEDLAADDFDFEDGLDGLHVWQRGHGADGAQIGGDGIAISAGLLHDLDEAEDAFQSTGLHGDDGGEIVRHIGRWQRWGRVGGQDHDGVSGAGLRGADHVRVGLAPGALGGLVGAQEVDEPARVGDGGGTDQRGDAEGGGMADELVEEVSEPDDLFWHAGGVERVMFHFVVFCSGLD